MTQMFQARWKGALKGLCAAILAGGLLGTSPALAAPIKIESENVIFYGDVDPVLAQERVRKWEIYRKMVYALSGKANPAADEIKLTIYGFRTTDDLQRFTDNYRIGGVYTQGIQGPIFLTPVNNKYNNDGWSEQVGLHEYTHHVLNSFVREGFPRWYDEGFANYLATMQITDDTIIVGDPTVAHVRSLIENRLKWINPATVLNAKAFYPNYSRREMRNNGPTVFYAQSWLYVHYLRSRPEYASKLSEYLKILETPGVSPIEAFETAHGVSMKDFHREALRYFRKDDFAITTYQPGPAIMDVDVKMTRLSEEDLKAAQVPARIAFLTDGNEGAFLKDVSKAIEENPNDPVVVMGLVNLDIRNERYEDAVARGESVFAANPKDVDHIRVGAFARFRKAFDAHWEDLEDDEFKPLDESDDMKLAMDRYKSILMKNAFDADAVTQVVQYYGNVDGEISDIGFDAARIYDVRFMDGFNPLMGMNLATIYAKRGFNLDACDYFQKSIDETKQFTARQLGQYKARLDWFEENLGSDCPFLTEDEG